MFCTNCGSQIDEGDRFCLKCGSPVEDASAAAGAAGASGATSAAGQGNPSSVQSHFPTQVPPEFQPRAQPQPQNQVQVQPQVQPAAAKKSSALPIFIAVAAVIIVILVAAIIFFLVADDNDSSSGLASRQSVSVSSTSSSSSSSSTNPLSVELSAYTKSGELLSGTINRDANKYVIPDSSTREYTVDEIAAMNLSPAELCIAWNEPFARAGYNFGNSDILNYFMETGWYHNSGQKFTLDGIAAKNVNRIQEVAARSTEASKWRDLVSDLG